MVPENEYRMVEGNRPVGLGEVFRPQAHTVLREDERSTAFILASTVASLTRD
jgi:hypothetical protein